VGAVWARTFVGASAKRRKRNGRFTAPLHWSRVLRSAALPGSTRPCEHGPMADKFMPLVKGATTSRSPDVSSLRNQLDRGTYYVPDYQRDSEQWDVPKRSLFIESLINNMTIPPLIVYPEDNPSTGLERNQVIDGQQRLTTIQDFVKGRFSLAGENDVEYAENVGPVIQGKAFTDLAAEIRDQILAYTVNIIVLPKNLDLHLRLEIFRRINEGGVPLSAHDLRLASFGDSDRVYFIRLAGVFDVNREGSARMVKAAKEKYGLDYPWKLSGPWKSWWEDTAQATGQGASQMFLYYVVARDRAAIQTLLESPKTQHGLGIKYDKTTVSVLDLYCAQAQAEREASASKIVGDLEKLRSWFYDFELWFNAIKSSKIPRVPVNSSTKLAFFIAAACNYWKAPADVPESQWELIQVFLTKGPTEIQKSLQMEFSQTRGKWPGQKKQIEQTFAICEKIAKT
jgi:hypothetical protein